MKTVVFVCLLSLSICLSQPTTNSEAPAAPTQQAAADPKPQATPNIGDKSAQKATSTETTTKESTAPSDATHESKTPQTPAKVTDDNKTEHKDTKGNNEATPVKPTEKALPAPAETKPAEKKPAPAPVDTKPATNESNAVVPVADNKGKKNDTTTVHPAVVTPTVAPNVTEKPTVLARGFDGASFVGGIILTLGLLAIGFMGFKYYKNQTERNYHTL